MTAEDHTIVIRTGVTETELTGKTWKPICLPLGLHSPSPTPSPSPNSSPSPIPSPKSSNAVHLPGSVANTTKDRSQISAKTCVVQNKESVSLPGYNNVREELMKVEKELGCMSLRESSPMGGESRSEEKCSNSEEPKMEKESPLGVKIQYPEDFPSSLSSSGISETSNYEHSKEVRIHSEPKAQEDSKNSSIVMSEANPTEEGHENSDKQNLTNQSPTEEDQTLHQLPKALSTQSSLEWSESRLRHISSSSGGSESGQCRGMSMVVPREDDGPTFPVLPLPADHLWLWVTGGGCWIQASNMPKW